MPGLRTMQRTLGAGSADGRTVIKGKGENAGNDRERFCVQNKAGNSVGVPA